MVFLVGLALILVAPAVIHADITSNLVSHWKMNEGSGTVVNDSGSGNADGTFGTGGNAPSWQSACPTVPCVRFAENDYLSFGAMNVVGGGSTTRWTIAARVKVPDAPTTNRYIIQNYGGTDGRAQYIIKQAPSGAIECSWCAGSNCSQYLYMNSNSATLLPVNTWVHVAWVNQGTTHNDQLLYVNGTAVATDHGTSATPPLVPTTGFGDTYIGGQADGTQGWEDDVRDVRIYTRALSAAEMLDLYNAPAEPPPNGGGTAGPGCLGKAVSGHTTLGTETCIWATVGASGLTLTLPPAASGVTVREYVMVKVDSAAGALTLAASGTNTLNGVASTPLSTTEQFGGFIAREMSATGWHVEVLKRQIP